MATINAGASLPLPLDVGSTPRVLPAKTGIALSLLQDQHIQIINTHGKQVVDTWAFESRNLNSHMSMEHIRARLKKLSIAIGDTLISNNRTPILTVVADTTTGVHDTLMAACDKTRYAEVSDILEYPLSVCSTRRKLTSCDQLGVTDYHPSCVDNFHHALRNVGLTIESVPSPLNLFMNVPVASNGALEFATPVSEPGQSITLRANTDLILVMSACPQDIMPVNGMSCTDISFIVT